MDCQGLGFRLAEMYSTSNMLMSDAHNETNDISDDAIYVVDSAMKLLYPKITSSYTHLINDIQKEIREGSKELVQLRNSQ